MAPGWSCCLLSHSGEFLARQLHGPGQAQEGGLGPGVQSHHVLPGLGDGPSALILPKLPLPLPFPLALLGWPGDSDPVSRGYDTFPSATQRGSDCRVLLTHKREVFQGRKIELLLLKSLVKNKIPRIKSHIYTHTNIFFKEKKKHNKQKTPKA